MLQSYNDSLEAAYSRTCQKDAGFGLHPFSIKEI